MAERVQKPSKKQSKTHRVKTDHALHNRQMMRSTSPKARAERGKAG